MHEVCVCFSCCIIFTSPPAGMLAFSFPLLNHVSCFCCNISPPNPLGVLGQGVQVDMQNAPAAATQRQLTPCKSPRSGRMQEYGVTHARLHRQLNLCATLVAATARIAATCPVWHAQPTLPPQYSLQHPTTPLAAGLVLVQGSCQAAAVPIVISWTPQSLLTFLLQT
jgi:hypothetical protein